MFEQFSSGYYLGRLYIEPHEGREAVMQRAQHERVNDQLYDEYDGPLVMKVGPTHLPVHGAEGVPGRTLALPESALAAAGVDNPPALREVLLAKADRAGQLLDIGADPADGPGAPRSGPRDGGRRPLDGDGSGDDGAAGF